MLVLHALYSHYRLAGRRLEVSLVKVLVHDVIDTYPDVLNRLKRLNEYHLNDLGVSHHFLLALHVRLLDFFIIINVFSGGCLLFDLNVHLILPQQIWVGEESVRCLNEHGYELLSLL
jgi:hypothetical protein